MNVMVVALMWTENMQMYYWWACDQVYISFQNLIQEYKILLKFHPTLIESWFWCMVQIILH